MKIAIIHLGETKECFVASTINKGLLQKYKDSQITWILKDIEQKSLFQYNKKVTSFLINDLKEKQFDLLINLSPSVHPSDPLFSAKEYKGFNFNPQTSKFYSILYENKRCNMNDFQIYYRLAGIVWEGQGYDIPYYPKIKANKKSIGLSILNKKLSDYVYENINVSSLNKFIVPYKKDIFEKIDELNKYSHVITDDYLIMHISIYLRKFVHFIETKTSNTRFEFFGKGQNYKVKNG